MQALKEEHIAETEDMQLAELRKTVSQRMPEMIDLLRASLLALDEKTHNATLDFLMANEALYPVLELRECCNNFSKTIDGQRSHDGIMANYISLSYRFFTALY